MRMQVALNGHRDRHVQVIPGVVCISDKVASMPWVYASYAVGKRACTLRGGVATVPRQFWPGAVLAYVRKRLFTPLTTDTPCHDTRTNRTYDALTSFCGALMSVKDSPQRMLEHPLILQTFASDEDLATHSVFKRAQLKHAKKRLQTRAGYSSDDVAMIDAQLKMSEVDIVDIEDLFAQVPPCMQALIQKKHYNFSERQAVFGLFLSAGADPEGLLGMVRRVNSTYYQDKGDHPSHIKSAMGSITKTWRHYRRKKTRHPNAGPFKCKRVQGLGLCSSSREACASRCGKTDMEGPIHFVQQLQGQGVFS